MEIEFEKTPRCSYCKKEIHTDKEDFIMARLEDGRDTYIHLLCHTKKIGKEIKRVVNLGFEKWKPQILDR